MLNLINKILYKPSKFWKENKLNNYAKFLAFYFCTMAKYLDQEYHAHLYRQLYVFEDKLSDSQFD